MNKIENETATIDRCDDKLAIDKHTHTHKNAANIQISFKIIHSIKMSAKTKHF